MAIHLHPTAELAERVLVPGDPGRALRLAQELIDGPLMFNHHRGLWGYSGPAKLDGEPLTIQSTGMGGPSAAIIISELIDLGARRLLRIGTCGGLDPALELGQLLIGTEVIADDGTSRALSGGRERLTPDAALLTGLQEAAGRLHGGAEPHVSPTATTSGAIVTTDLFYDAQDRHAGWRAQGARAVEMEAATLLALAQRRAVQAAVLLVVSDLLDPHVRIGEAELHAAESRLGQTAIAAI